MDDAHLMLVGKLVHSTAAPVSIRPRPYKIVLYRFGNMSNLDASSLKNANIISGISTSLLHVY